MTSFFQKLGFGLKKSSAKLTGGISDIFTKRRVDTQTLDELEELLISSDLGVRASAKIIGSFAKRRLNKGYREYNVYIKAAALKELMRLYLYNKLKVSVRTAVLACVARALYSHYLIGVDSCRDIYLYCLVLSYSAGAAA